MSLFKVFSDIVTLPVRVVVDVVKLPGNLVEGEDLLQNTSKGIKKLEEDLDE